MELMEKQLEIGKMLLSLEHGTFTLFFKTGCARSVVFEIERNI